MSHPSQNEREEEAEGAPDVKLKTAARPLMLLLPPPLLFLRGKSRHHLLLPLTCLSTAPASSASHAPALPIPLLRGEEFMSCIGQSFLSGKSRRGRPQHPLSLFALDLGSEVVPGQVALTITSSDTLPTAAAACVAGPNRHRNSSYVPLGVNPYFILHRRIGCPPKWMAGAVALSPAACHCLRSSSGNISIG